MKKKHEQAMALLDAMEQVDEALLTQATETDTPEKFRALSKAKLVHDKQVRRRPAFYPWIATAACLILILALAASPWFFSSLLPVITPTNPTEPDDTEPTIPNSPLIILSGDQQLTNPVEYLNHTETYNDSTGQWDSIMGWDAYWAVHDVFTQNISLPQITLGEDIQLVIENNGELKAISAFRPDYYGDPWMEMTSTSEQNLFSLTGGQWYIVAEIWWQGRYIESEDAYEVFVYNYLFLLDVPDVKGQPFDWDFDEATATLTIYNCEEIPAYGSAYSDELPPWHNVMHLIEHIVITEGVKTIGAYAFSEMPKLLTVTLPNSLEEIEECAFYYNQQLKEVNTPENLRLIGKSAFELCKALERFTTGSKIETIEQWAFAHCTALQEVTILGSPRYLRNPFEGCNTLQVIRFCGDAPDNLQGLIYSGSVFCYYPADNATWTDDLFENMTANTVWVASKDPLTDQSHADTRSGPCGNTASWALKDGVLTISGNGSINYVGWYDYKSEITKVIIEEGITNIYAWAFRDCTNLTQVVIASTVESIENSAFMNCQKLKSIKLPQNLTYLGDDVFMDCKALKSIVIPDGITVIPKGAFADCTALQTVTLSKNLTEIGKMAFKLCTSLKKITFPEGLKILRDEAFSQCTSLRTMYFYGDVPTTGANTFNNVEATAYYPPGNESWTNGGMKVHSGNIRQKPNPEG